MLPALRPIAVALLLTTLATSTLAQDEPVPRRVRAERAHQELLRAQRQQQLGAVAGPVQGLAFDVAGAQNGMAAVVGWTGAQADELDAPSWDVVESEADAAEDDVLASLGEQEEERIERASWGRRAHLKKRATPRVKPTTTIPASVSTSAESTPTVAAESASAAAWSIPGASSSAGVASASAQSSADSASTIASTSTSESSTSASAEISSTSSGTSSDTYASVPTSSSVSSSVSTTSAPSSTITSSPSSLGANSTVPSLITSTRLNATLTSSLSPAPTNATLTRALAAAATTSTLCAAKWLAPTMISGTGTLPKPTSFVKRQPTGLGLGLEGASWKIVGTNIYWICNNEDTLPKAQLTSKTRIREALAIAVAMGANTVRLISCGTSVGTVYSVEPKLGSFNQVNFQQVDYVVYAAREYGLRVIMPLTDNYQYYHGGKYTFLWWRAISTANSGSQFYTNNLAIASFKSYILNMVTRTNIYTGVKYCNDPTILAWETGNELGAYLGAEGYPPLAWTKNIASYIKSLAPLQLVIDGSDGFLSGSGTIAPGVNVDAVDIMTDHAYPRNIALVNSEITIAKQYNKGFLIGEWDWRSTGGGDTLAAYIRKLESHYYLGDLVWSIQGHDDECCAFLPHNDGYSIYYPNGNSAVDMAAILQVVQHNYRMTYRTPPTVLPGVACPQPAF